MDTSNNKAKTSVGASQFAAGAGQGNAVADPTKRRPFRPKTFKGSTAQPIRKGAQKRNFFGTKGITPIPDSKGAAAPRR